MRLAVTGAHCTGKTTLVEALVRVLPSHVAIEEPYRVLEAEGHVFEAMPSLEDFVLQLDRSVERIEIGDTDRGFDRCPTDYLAYLGAHREAARFDLAACLPRVQQAMRQLDLLIFVPIERPDRIAGAEYPKLRRRVDEELREIVLDDRWGFGVESLEVVGRIEERVRQVLVHIESMQGGTRSG